MSIWPGDAYPLGATWDGQGTNFALFSEVAEGVDLCLFDPAGNETRIALTEVDSYVWHGYLPEVSPGQHYGYRVHGPWDPVEGRVCNPHKLLLDPYAKAVRGTVRFTSSCANTNWSLRVCLTTGATTPSATLHRTTAIPPPLTAMGR